MLNFIKFFQGYLFVSIQGYSPERFLNLCSSHNIVLWELSPIADGYTFYLSLKAFRRLKPLLKKTGTRIRIIKRCGLPFLLFRYRKHRFFVVGITCACLILAVMSRFIWKVEISGNSYYSSQVLTEYLRDSGIGYGVPKKKTDCAAIQAMLRKQFDDITWVSARISGTRLYLVIQERVQGTEGTAVIEDDTPADLVADYSGTVESVVVRKGTPAVSKGDQVEKGDILVYGHVDITDDAGEVINTHDQRADADVLIRTEVSYRDTFSRTIEKMQETGEKKYQCSILFDRYSFTFGSRTPNSLTWDKTTQLYPVKVGKDFYLPFSLSLSKYEEYEQIPYIYTEEEGKTIAKEHFAQYSKKLKENGIQILENSVIIDENDTSVTVSGKMKLIIKAAKFEKTDVSDTQEVKTEDGIDTADDGHSD